MVVSFMYAASPENETKRRKLNADSSSTFSSPSLDLQKHASSEIQVTDEKVLRRNQLCSGLIREEIDVDSNKAGSGSNREATEAHYPKYGVVSVQGKREEMEDAVAVHLSFCSLPQTIEQKLHYFAVYDGHGCSHAAMVCRDRMHELIKEELKGSFDSQLEFEAAMVRSFARMDNEVISLWKQNQPLRVSNCRCDLQFPECDAVGSTALVSIITADKIVVSNCGDSRAVLCRNGNPIPLSCDHKPDRPDELRRIENAGGKVTFCDSARVLGVLSMSRAIGDNYLKPYVSCAAEVESVDRNRDDECLILGSDGLWDVVPNEMACRVAHVCLGAGDSEKACLDASRLLTKLALARRSSDNISVIVVDLKST